MLMVWLYRTAGVESGIANDPAETYFVTASVSRGDSIP
jgi:hypothetical protein